MDYSAIILGLVLTKGACTAVSARLHLHYVIGHVEWNTKGLPNS